MHNPSFDPQLKRQEHHPSCPQYVPPLPPNFIQPTDPQLQPVEADQLQAPPYPPLFEADQERTWKHHCDQGIVPSEGSTTQNFLRVNRGKSARVYMNFAHHKEWSVFNGNIGTVGDDYFMLTEPKSGKRYLLLFMFLNYIEFGRETH